MTIDDDLCLFIILGKPLFTLITMNEVYYLHDNIIEERMK